jgi:hypothetical protein
LIDGVLKDLFRQVERYVSPITQSDSGSNFSKDENKILALQQLTRLNQRIGLIARTTKDELENMKLLQTYVNSITSGVKNDNLPQIRYGMTQARNMILLPDKETQSGQTL